MPELNVTMLGGFRIEWEGEPVNISANKSPRFLQFFQMVLLHGEDGISRDEVLQSLYGTRSLRSPSNSLNNLLFQLRGKMRAASLPEAEYIVCRGKRYYPDPEIEYRVDVLRFKDLTRQAQRAQAQSADSAAELYREAFELYRGPLLPDAADETWAERERIRLILSYREAGCFLAEAAAADGNEALVQRIRAQALRIHPEFANHRDSADTMSDAGRAEGARAFGAAAGSGNRENGLRTDRAGGAAAGSAGAVGAGAADAVGSADAGGSAGRGAADAGADLPERTASAASGPCLDAADWPGTEEDDAAAAAAAPDLNLRADEVLVRIDEEIGRRGRGDLRVSPESACWCSRESFTIVCHEMTAIQQRVVVPMHLMVFTIADYGGRPFRSGRKLEERAAFLDVCIADSLRRGDAYTRIAPSQYAALLIGYDEKERRRAMRSIRGRMRGTFGSTVKILWSESALADTKTTDAAGRTAANTTAISEGIVAETQTGDTAEMR